MSTYRSTTWIKVLFPRSLRKALGFPQQDSVQSKSMSWNTARLISGPLPRVRSAGKNPPDEGLDAEARGESFVVRALRAALPAKVLAGRMWYRKFDVP